jgi:alcohol dehydrogenase (NADP+)
MQKLVKPNGSVRFIGVSNFSPGQMEDIMKLPGIKPKVHQFEMHPYLQQSQFLKWHVDNKIAVTGYAPLANTSPSYRASYDHSIPLLTNNTVLRSIKTARSCASEIQVALAWNIRRNVTVIPKASKGPHQDENLEAEKCRLTDEDMERIGKFTTETKWVARMNNPCKIYSMPCFKGLEEPSGGGFGGTNTPSRPPTK